LLSADFEQHGSEGRQMQFLAIYLYVIAVGFVAAGVLASFVQLVSGEPLRFSLQPNTFLESFGGVLLRVLAGPAILMRNAWRGQTIQRRPKYWFGVSALIAALWSLFSGAALLDLIVKL
jgi:hypothetical protein